jgi:hypothetical protein
MAGIRRGQATEAYQQPVDSIFSYSFLRERRGVSGLNAICPEFFISPIIHLGNRMTPNNEEYFGKEGREC